MPKNKPRHINTKGKKPKKNTKPRLVKTNSKAYRPFTLTNPIIMTDGGEIDDAFTQHVEEELWAMHTAMIENEAYFYNEGFLKIIEGFSEIEDPKRASGKKNSALRGILDKPVIAIPDPAHQYNFMEMLRTNVGSKVQIYITRSQLQEVIAEDPSRKPQKIREEYVKRFGNDDAPSTSAIKKHVSAYMKTGQVDRTASASGLLPLSACDGHYRNIDAESNAAWIFVTFKLACGTPTLAFKKPKNRKRYSNGRITAPTLRFDEEKHDIFYDFSLQQNRPKKRKMNEMSGMLGIDCGEVHTAVMTYVGRDLTYSQPFFESHRIKKIEQAISALYEEIDALRSKASLNEALGWFDKADVLYDETEAKRHKISKLKKQKGVLVASEAVGMALVLDAGIAVEDLSWKPESHWDCAAFQKALVDLAADVGLPVVKVNPAHTSTHCPHCGAKLVDKGARQLYCPKCECSLDRDIIASRSVGLRGLGYDIGDMRYFRYCLSSLSSRADRRVRVDRARHYKTGMGADQRPCSIPDVEACVFANSS